VVPFHRDAEACGAGADDADVTFDCRVVGQEAGVGVHGFMVIGLNRGRIGGLR